MFSEVWLSQINTDVFLEIEMQAEICVRKWNVMNWEPDCKIETPCEQLLILPT